MIFGFKYLVISCIRENILIVKDELIQHIASFSDFSKNWRVTQREDVNFKEIYYPFPPLGGAHFQNFIIWEPLNKPNTTVFYVNLSDGWNSLMEVYADKWKKECIHISMSDKSLNDPMCHFYYYCGKNKRIIQSYKDDDKWVFYETGNLLPFEETQYYKKRYIKDRLPNELIMQYLSSMGWDIAHRDFWNTKQLVFNFKRIQWE